MVEKIHELSERKDTWQETTELVGEVNRSLRGWANYFQVGIILFSSTTGKWRKPISLMSRKASTAAAFGPALSPLWLEGVRADLTVFNHDRQGFRDLHPVIGHVR